MTRLRGVRSLATTALIVAAMASCADNGDPVAEPSTSPSSPTPASTTTTASATSPTPPSDSEAAAGAASAVLQKYYDVRNQLRQDSSQPISMLDDVAISTELAAQRNLFKKERQRGLHQVGTTKVAKVEVQSVNLDNSDPKAGKVPTVQIDLCFDVSDVDVIDRDGTSVISPDRPDTGWIQFLVSNYHWDKQPQAGWRVASSQDLQRTPCEAS